MSNDDHGLNDLVQTPKRPESGSPEIGRDPHRKSSSAAFFIARLALAIGIIFLVFF